MKDLNIDLYFNIEQILLNWPILLLFFFFFLVTTADNIALRTSGKHTYIILTPSTPILYSKNGVYRDIHYFFLFLLKNIDCVYSLESPHGGSSNILMSTH